LDLADILLLSLEVLDEGILEISACLFLSAFLSSVVFGVVVLFLLN